jgi:hypothetical protein
MLLYNTPIDLHVNVSVHPLTGKPCFLINEYLPNPTLILYRGYTYNINVDADILSTGVHSFEIKENRTQIGTGYYTDGISSSSVHSGSIKWKVAQTGPDLVVYQSKYDFDIDNIDDNMYGLIYILEPPAMFENTLKTVNLNNTFTEFIEAYNHNMSTALTTAYNIAGTGLKWTGATLSLDNPSEYTFYLDGNNDLISTGAAFHLNDGLTANIDLNIINDIKTRPKTLFNVINEIALLIRRIKDPALAYSAPPITSMKDLQTQIDELEQVMNAIATRIYEIDYKLAQGV